MLSFHPYSVANECLEHDRSEDALGLLGLNASITPNFKDIAALGDALYYSLFRSESLVYYQKALDLLPKKPHDREIHLTYLNILLQLSVVYIFLGNQNKANTYLKKAESILDVFIDTESRIIFHLYSSLYYSLEDEIVLCNNHAAKAAKYISNTKKVACHRYWQFHLLVHHILQNCDQSNVKALITALTKIVIKPTKEINEEMNNVLSAYKESQYNVVKMPNREKSKINLFKYRERYDAVEAIYKKDSNRSGQVLNDMMSFYCGRIFGNSSNKVVYERFSKLHNGIVFDTHFSETAHSLKQITFDIFVGDHLSALTTLFDAVWKENMLYQKDGLLLHYNKRRYIQQYTDRSSALLLSLLVMLQHDPSFAPRAYNLLLQRKSLDAEIEQIFYAALKTAKDPGTKVKIAQWEWLNNIVLINALKSIRGPEGAVAFTQAQIQHQEFLKKNPELKEKFSEHPSREDMFNNGSHRLAWMTSIIYNQNNDVILRDKLEDELRELLLENIEIPSINDAEHLKIIKSLQSNTCLLEFFRSAKIDCDPGVPKDYNTSSKEYYYCFILKAEENTVIFKELGEVSLIDGAISDYRSMVTDDNDRVITKSSVINNLSVNNLDVNPIQLLTNLLYLPIEELIEDCSNIVIAPDGELCRLPFQILKTSINQFLIETKTITYIGSGKDLLNHVNDTQTTTSVLITNPAFTLPSQKSITESFMNLKKISYGQLFFKPLSYSKAEQNSIESLHKLIVYSGEEASVSNIKSLNSPQFLHITTHGLYLTEYESSSVSEKELKEKKLEQGWIKEMGLENPMYRSLIALAGANEWLLGNELSEKQIPGFITALDFGKLNLTGTKLVVLSACETGLGDIQTSAGVIGLRLGIKISGAASLITTLWKIPDMHTSILIKHFYKELANGKDKVSALRIAQLKVKETYENPLFWGGFIFEQYLRDEVINKNYRPASQKKDSSKWLTDKSEIISHCRRHGIRLIIDPAFSAVQFPLVSLKLGAQFGFQFDSDECFYEFETSDSLESVDNEIYFRKKAAFISKGQHPPIGHHPQAATRRDFNADWSASSMISAVEFTESKFRLALVTGIYSAEKGWIWILLLTNSTDIIPLQKSITLAYDTIKFI